MCAQDAKKNKKNKKQRTLCVVMDVCVEFSGGRKEEFVPFTISVWTLALFSLDWVSIFSFAIICNIFRVHGGNN